MNEEVIQQLSLAAVFVARRPNTPASLQACNTVYAASTLPRSLTYRPSKNFRISLFLTRHACWISAADCDTFSSELPLSSS